MTNLESSVPGAFNAMYGLLATAGALQTPAVPVFHSEILQYEPSTGCVLLQGVEQHRFEWASLGPFDFYETYDICGHAEYFQSGEDPVAMAEAVLNQTWAIYQAVVMSTVVVNRGQPGGQVLGSAAPLSLEVIIPADANYAAQPASVGGSADGLLGVVEFRFSVKARITTA